MNAIGRVLRSRYEIMTELGKGGMSTVYLAKDKHLDSYWAVKQVKNNTNVDIGAFKKEVELLSSLSHSDIPRIVDRIEIEDDYFVIMDFIDGASLGKKVLADGPIAEKDVVEYGMMLCDVLQYLHTAKGNPIIYRDMKPDNVMLTQSGRTKLIDFGIAKECRPGEVQTGPAVGTRGFAAPEQYKGASNILDTRTDVYSLGATMFYLLTGLLPGNPPKGVKPIRQVNPLLSEGIEYIIAKCTDDDPDWRYQNCTELKEDLKNIEKLNSVYRRSMRRKLISFGASVAVMALCVALTFFGYNGNEREKEVNYQHYYSLATDAQNTGDYIEAARNYAQAIPYRSNDLETYLLYFNSILPRGDDPEHVQKTKSAIDDMRSRFLENDQSPMYRDNELMYQVGRQCVAVNDSAYAAYAVNYFALLRERRVEKEDLASLEIIAVNCAKNLATMNFDELHTALADLEETTDIARMMPNDKLQNYYLLMTVYSGYPQNVTDAYLRIAGMGEKAKAIIDENASLESLTFGSIIPMYEMVASSVYSYASELEFAGDDAKQKKREQYDLCIQWFGYLNDLNDDLSETLWIKKANAYKGVFDIYNANAADRGKIDAGVVEYLDASIEEYGRLTDAFGTSFLGYVHLTKARLDKELLKTVQAERDFTVVQSDYAATLRLKNQADLPINALAQFSALRQAVINAGLEG